MRRAPAAILVAAVLALAPASASAAPQVLARELAPFVADVESGHIAWSSYDPAIDAFRLKVRVPDGRVLEPDVAPRALPFDVDLGPGPRGGLAAVYSRCRVQGRVALMGEFGLPERRALPQSGCDLFLLDLRTGVERRLAALSSSSRDETRPSLHSRRIAFVRSNGRRDDVYVADLDGRRLARLPAPAAGVTRRAATWVEHAGHELAVVWVTDRTEFDESQLWRIKGRRVTRAWVTRSGGANASRIVSPDYYGPYMYFAETNNGSGTGNRIYRYTVRSGRLAEARGSSRYTSLGRLVTGAFAVTTEADSCAPPGARPLSQSRCTLTVTDRVRFRGVRRR